MNSLRIQSLKSVVTNFLGNNPRAEYEKGIEEQLKNFRQLGERMSVKEYFLWSHYFPKNDGDFREEQGNHFHQDICIIEERYRGRWDVKFLADYCWCLKQDAVAAEHKGRSLKRPFIHEYLLLCIFLYTREQCELSVNISVLNLALFF